MVIKKIESSLINSTGINNFENKPKKLISMSFSGWAVYALSRDRPLDGDSLRAPLHPKADFAERMGSIIELRLLPFPVSIYK